MLNTMISHDGHAWDVGGYPIFRSTGMYTETQEGYQQFCWLNQTTSSEEQQAEKKSSLTISDFGSNTWSSQLQSKTASE